jgi:hypothetical protein
MVVKMIDDQNLSLGFCNTWDQGVDINNGVT